LFTDLNSFTTVPEAYLVDNFLNTNTLIKENGFYAFDINENNPFTFGNNRFEIAFSKANTLTENILKRKNQTVLTVYPNPATDVLNISLSNGIAVEIVNIYDVSGKLVKTTKLNGNQIDISQLNNGVYMLEAISANVIFKTKFVK